MGETVEGCTGACCAAFYFPRTPREIGQLIELNGQYNGYDGRMIEDMLIPLTDEQVTARAAEFGFEDPGRGNYYTCRHWDDGTRLCGVYDHRPQMCSAYPYERACGHCGTEGGCQQKGHLDHGCAAQS